MLNCRQLLRRPALFARALRRWWASACCTDGLDESLAGRVRAYQLRALFKINALMTATTVLTATVVAVTFWSQSPRSVCVWLCAILYFFACQLNVLARSRRQKAPATASPRGIEGAERTAIWLGFVWGSVPLLFYPEAEPGEAYVLATITTGMLCVGSLALAMIPRAAIIYASVTVYLTLAALVSGPIERVPATVLILLILLVTICGTVVTYGKQATKHVVDQQLIADAAAEQKRLREAMQFREIRARSILDSQDGAAGAKIAAGPRNADCLATVIGVDRNVAMRQVARPNRRAS